MLAIGNPFGVLNQTVTLGIVSATGRNLQGSLATYVDFIQTDAAINQGNSGGALVNARGELIGINTAIFSQSGGSQGVGFAVPSNVAKHVMEEILKYGEVRRGTITGIELYPMNTSIAEEFKAPNTKGVIVSGISQSSEAYAAGIRRGDIIVQLQRHDDRGRHALHAHAGRLADRRHGLARRLPGRADVLGESAGRSVRRGTAAPALTTRHRVASRREHPPLRVQARR